MRAELTANPQRKKERIKQMRRKNLKFSVCLFYLKAFSLFRWLAPIVLCAVRFLQAVTRGSSLKDYEWIALVINCVVLFFAFSFGGWLLRYVVNSVSGGISLENEEERIVLEETGWLTYTFRNRRQRMCEKILLSNTQIKINEDIGALLISGRILCHKVNRNGTLGAPQEKRSEILIDYYEPGLIETLQKKN